MEYFQTIHEGTNQMKDSKTELIFQEYKLFKMKSRENITDMYKKFSNLMNDLKGLGKRFETVKLVKKII